ncbi:MAG: phytanoyl-CoA dioxygenase family protein [Phycisphaerales bacterium]
MSDLSHRHEAVGALLDGADPAGESVSELTAEQLGHFETHGYVAGIRILDAGQIAQLRAELEVFMKPEHEGRELWHEYHINENADPDAVVFHALGAWRISAGFHDLLWHPAFTGPAGQLLEGPVRFWHDQLFCKPPRHGGNVAWHQDYSYWTRTKPLGHLTCWIALDDATSDNGCLRYIPGSHRWSLLPKTGLIGDMDAVGNVLDDQQRAAMKNPVAIELKAGECTFHHPMLMHGSGPNRTDLPRRAAVLNVVRDGVRSMSEEPLLAGQPPLGIGTPLGGRFHPLLTGAAAPRD